MSTKPELKRFEQFGEIMVQLYERYLPTAFDESLTLLEKMNKIIHYLNEIGKVTNELIEEWNKVMEWILNDGLEDLVKETLERWYEEGKFADLVIQVIDELKQFGVSVKTYGAKGDGVTDDIKAFEKAIESGFPVYVPYGTFMVSRGIKLPSNTVLTGAGKRNAVIKFMDSVGRGESLMYNENVTTGNENIFLSSFTLDGNNKRLGQGISGIGGSRESNLSIRACHNVYIRDIEAVDCTLHGIDITCGGLDYPYLGDGTTAPNPSENIWIENCEATGFGDDGITTHHSQYINILNCYSHDPRLTANCNGFEIDDGSRHVVLSNNRSKGCYGGIEIKAHGDAPAAYNISVNGHMSVEDVRSYNFRHIGHHATTDPQSVSAKNIVASNLVSIRPNNKRGFQDNATPRVLAVSAYYGVVINGLTGYTDDPNLLTETVVSVQFRARNCSLNGVVLTGFSNSENGIYVIGGSRGGDAVNISNVTLNNSGRYGVSIGSGIENVSITNISGIGDGINSPVALVSTINSNPEISGLSSIGYPTVARVAGTDYNDGLTLFNGAFRASTTSSGKIHSEGFIMGSTSGCEASVSKSGVLTSSSSKTSSERSLIAGSSTSEAKGTYNTILGSLGAVADEQFAALISASQSRASGNHNLILSSYGINTVGSYKVNGGFEKINWELDSLNGRIKARDTVTGGNTWSDFAEYFESLDGQVIETGYLVTLEKGKIRKAEKGEKIIGVISETAGFVLGESSFEWQGAVLKNEFGGIVYEEVTTEDGVKFKRPLPNPDFDPNKNYIPRSQRREWHVVGLLGQIAVRIDETVKQGHGIDAVGGVATDGDNFIVKEITTPYTKEKGYGVAIVLVK
ncbi:pre-neck appendage protein [Bacillus phage TBA3]|nr:pre-neck appendage protein [Bacillus phage TBA3]